MNIYSHSQIRDTLTSMSLNFSLDKWGLIVLTPFQNIVARQQLNH